MEKLNKGDGTMKKAKMMFALFMSALCVSAPLQAWAEENTKDYGTYFDTFEVTTDLFSYHHGLFQTISEDIFIPQTDGEKLSVVTGVCYNEEQNEPYAYVFLTMNLLNRDSPYGYTDPRYYITKETLAPFVGDKVLQVGDCFYMDDMIVAETAPPYVYPEKLEFIGNGADLFGDNFNKVMKHEVAVSIAQGFDDIDESLITKGEVTENGTVGIVDVLATNQYLLGVYHPSNYGILAADVNRNGKVEDADAMMILKSLVGLETLE